MNHKVKVGDKIRLLTNGGYAGVCKPGDVLTVTEVRKGAHYGAGVEAGIESGGTRYFSGTEYELLTETPPAETELERLVRVANEGFKAADRIYSMGLQEQLECGGDNQEYMSLISTERSSGWNYRIKPKPVFEPFYVGHANPYKGWLVKLEGDMLHVGCQQFPASNVKAALTQLVKGECPRYVCVDKSEYIAYRNGVGAGGSQQIGWADADRILYALEKAGV